MRTAQWKATERAVAKRLGGRRVPITGRQRGDAPDVAHEHLSVEVKHRANLPLWLHDAMSQAMAAARAGQLPLVVLHQAGQRHDNDYVVIRMRDYTEWYGDINAPTTAEARPCDAAPCADVVRDDALGEPGAGAPTGADDPVDCAAVGAGRA